MPDARKGPRKGPRQQGKRAKGHYLSAGDGRGSRLLVGGPRLIAAGNEGGTLTQRKRPTGFFFLFFLFFFTPS